jgi:aldehyde dehydrogenase (NAD+)
MREDGQMALRDSYGLFIGGDFVPGSSVFKTISPATEEVLAEVTHGASDDVDRAVAAARHAYEHIWSALPGRVRGRYLLKIARLLRDRAPELAVIETIDSGKPVRVTRDGDLPLAAANFFYHAGWADKLGYAGFGAAPRPLGVVGQVIGWNSPLLMLAWQAAPALACGNTVVLKPAETTPLTALAFAELCAEAGLPPGVVNVVTGDGSTGQLLASHPGLDKVSFSGSAEVGRELARACALSGKGLTLELGGAAAHIVCEDADLEAAAEGIVAGVFIGQGHVCGAGGRLLVAAPVAVDLVAAIRRRMLALRLGDPLDPGTDVGPVTSQAQLDRVRELSESIEAAGGTRWSPPCAVPDRGFWFPPAMFTEAPLTELAGPVLTVSSFGTPAEAVELANGTRYGMSAAVWTERGSLSAWLASRLRTGVVWANTVNRFDPAAPIGGYQEAGFGRDGGRHGLEAYLDIPGMVNV